MSWLFEDSLLAAVLGLALALVLGYSWLQSGKRKFLFGAIVCILLSVLAILIERWVTTDREAVEGVLFSAAGAVERNDLHALMQYVHSQAPDIRAQATAEFPRYEFKTVRIKSNNQITIDRAVDPPEATASFNVVVTGRMRDHPLDVQQVPRYAIVRFRKQGDAWRVTGYEHHEPTMGFKQPRRE